MLPQNRVQENFCPLCVAAIPLAFSGAAGGAAVVKNKKKSKGYTITQIFLIILSILMVIGSIGLVIYAKKKGCSGSRNGSCAAL